MGGRIPDETIDLIRDRTDITQVVSPHVSLKRSGGNFLGLCPFHTEKTPSFNVSPERQTFHCFGCGVGGNVFTFLMRIEGQSFPEVVERLAREKGIELPRRPVTPAEARARSERERLIEITAAAGEFFEAELGKSESAKAYLAGRGVGDESIARYQVGYAPDNWTALAEHLERKGFAPALGEKAGLLIARRASGHYDRFRHRIVFPIQNLNGHTVGFGGRALGGGKTTGDEVKYLNSPETPLYEKGRALFGILQARESVRREGRVILVEGYFDTILLAESGIENVAAPCGTALTSGQIRVLRRFAEDIVVVFDSDDAGRRATERAMHLFLDEGVQGFGVALPEGLDPDDFVRRDGPDALRQHIRLSRPLLEDWVVRQTEGVRSFAERGRRAAVIGAVIRKIQNPIERDLYLKLSSERLRIEERLMRENLKSGTGAPEPAEARKGEGAAASAEADPAGHDPALAKIARAEEELLAYIFRAPELLGDPAVEEALGSFLSPPTAAVARVVLDAGVAEPAHLVDRAEKPEVGSLVTRLASLEAPMDDRQPIELFRAGAWQLGRMRVEREIRALSDEMKEQERQGELGAELLQRKVALTRKLEKYKGMSVEPTPPGST